MGDIFSGIKARLKEIKKEEWYDEDRLKTLDLYSDTFEKPDTGVLTKNVAGKFYILGASLAHYWNRRFNLGLGGFNSMNSHSLALAIGNPGVYAYIRENPGVVLEKEISSKKGCEVRADSLVKFARFIPRDIEAIETSKKRLLDLLPRFDLDFQTLAHISKNRNKSLEQLAKDVGQEPAVLRGAMFLLGYKEPKSREEIASVGKQIYKILNPGTRDWTRKETETLKTSYFFTPSSQIADTLHRTEADVEYEAVILGLERFSGKEWYTISEVLRLSRICYDVLHNELLAGGLETKVYEPDYGDDDLEDKEYDEVPRGAVLIKGESLIKLFDERKKGKRKTKWVKTRAERYVFGDAVNPEEIIKEKDAGEYRRVTSRHEINPLTGKIEDKARVNTPLHLVKSYAQSNPLMSEDEETDAVRNKDESLLAFDDLVEANLRLAIYVAGVNNYKCSRGAELIDMIQDGFMGLIRGARRYDINKAKERGETKIERYKFSTYAYWWIKQNVIREAGNYRRKNMVSLDTEAKVNKFFRFMMQNAGREPDVDEIARETGLEKKAVIGAIRARNRALASLDVSIKPRKSGGSDDGAKLSDLVEDKKAERPEEVAARRYRHERIMGALDELDPRAKNVIIYRYGLDGKEERTLEETGKIMKITRERVRQLQRKAEKNVRLAILLKDLDKD